ncbi:MAG: NADH:flavin oxidoreductase [Anaerolineales bacterium]|nr:MAG: NADH:flavin oxidoreductase [Anaerolineales bacterium]
MPQYQRLASLKTADAFRAYIVEHDIPLSFDDTLEVGNAAPLAQPLQLRNGFTIGNRFCVLPMEGWDGTSAGFPTELTVRRWQRFGLSGAKLIWGGEAVAVQPDGRANPNQLMINAQTLGALTDLREALRAEHKAHCGSTDDLLIGLQLTHSGRFARPNIKTLLEPRILYHHPMLDTKFGTDPELPIITDAYIHNLIETFIRSAKLAQQAGFSFVDIKHCHGYLGHEFLSAYDRPGIYGGCFENRTRFLREIVAGIRAEVPGLEIGVRLSAFDFVPFRPGSDGIGEPTPLPDGTYRNCFGGDGTGLGINLDEAYLFLDLLANLGIELVNITAGSPYYNPHIQRPALFPPSDGYQPPEDPLVGVARQIQTVAQLKAYRPDLVFVGSGYSYLQEWLPNVGQNAVRNGKVDFVGLGRMVLSYPDMAADVLAGKELDRRRICRTFSDCTTAPRKGLVSGCYPLDHYYKTRPEAETLKAFKQAMKS